MKDVGRSFWSSPGLRVVSGVGKSIVTLFGGKRVVTALSSNDNPGPVQAAVLKGGKYTGLNYVQDIPKQLIDKVLVAPVQAMVKGFIEHGKKAKESGMRIRTAFVFGKDAVYVLLRGAADMVNGVTSVNVVKDVLHAAELAVDVAGMVVGQVMKWGLYGPDRAAVQFWVVE